MNEVYALVGDYAEHDDPVLILGETGTGKELVAAALHSYGPRKDRPFVALNCSAMPASLLESELFGNEKGAFTGAEKVRKGLFEYTDGGTLFLDEIGEMPADFQPKLLRVLEERRVRRVGGNEAIPVDFRLVSATHPDLRRKVRDGRFRTDLYQRLNCLPVNIPPLRDRMDDLPELVDYFLTRAALPGAAISAEALAKLRAYSWPGNVRELRNTIRRACVRCRGSVILPAHIELDLQEEADPAPAAPPRPRNRAEAVAAFRGVVEWAWGENWKKLSDELLALLERELYRLAWEKCDGNQSRMKE
jgi:two-component system nitrogen regulation response regulator GlnG